MLGTLYAVAKLRSILKLFRKENMLHYLFKHITGEMPEDIKKNIRSHVDKKVEKIVNDIRVRQ